MEAAVCAKPATGYTYARREPEKAAPFQVLQQHLLTFEQEWTDKSDGRTLPSFVTEELRDFLGCGVLARGFAQLPAHERGGANSGRSRAARGTHPTIRADAAFLAEISLGLRREIAGPSPAHLHRHRGVQLSQAPGRSGHYRRRVWRRHGHPARQQRPASLTAFSCPPPQWPIRPWARPRASFAASSGFNLHAQTKVAANDKKGRENLCKYILRPPLAAAGRSRGKPAGFAGREPSREGLETLPGFPCRRPLENPRRRRREAGAQAALDGWHLVGRPCAARPHCRASRDRAPSSSACRQILGGYLLAQLSPQPSRPRPRRGGTRGEGHAFTAPFTLHFLEPAPQKDIRDRRHHQEDSQSHGTAYRGAQTLACTTAALAI